MGGVEVVNYGVIAVSLSETVQRKLDLTVF